MLLRSWSACSTGRVSIGQPLNSEIACSSPWRERCGVVGMVPVAPLGEDSLWPIDRVRLSISELDRSNPRCPWRQQGDVLE